MQTDDPGPRRFVEVADDGVAHHPVQLGRLTHKRDDYRSLLDVTRIAP
jgi:hypothetical protein